MKQTKRVLSVVLALAMVFAMSIMVSAATPACTSKVAVDGTTVSVTLYGTGADLQMFDYGIAYDTEKLEFSKVKWNNAVFAPEDGEPYAMKSANNQGSYVVIGGSHTEEFKVAEGVVIATVIFNAKAEVTDAAALVAVVADSADVVTKLGGDITSLTVTTAKENGGQSPEFDKPNPPASEEAPASVEPTESAPASAAPASEAPASKAPASAAPASAAPASAAPASKAPVVSAAAPKTADTASVVIPVVAICAAAAAVVVASKKRVED